MSPTPVIVLRAVNELRDAGQPPATCAELAARIDADANEVLSILIDLKGRRILRDHRRGRRREWQRWGRQ